MTQKRFDLTAIIYDRRGRVLSVGKNSYIKTHPLQAIHTQKMGEPYKQVLHAEIHAITRCADIDRAYKILITRYDADGNPVAAKPCKICMSAIAATNIKRIEHT